MKSFIESIIRTGNYILAEMEERIQKMYVVGKLTAEEMAELLALAAENAKDQFQIDVTAKLKELVVDAAGNIIGTYYNGEFIPVNAGDEEQAADEGENT